MKAANPRRVLCSVFVCTRNARFKIRPRMRFRSVHRRRGALQIGRLDARV
jgi:hypothetical protein